jgi:hypothetical protein
MPHEKPVQNLENILRAKNKWERKLWQEIEGADWPIQNILKRINRVYEDTSRFGETGISTLGSCSGHIQKNGREALNKPMSKICGQNIPHHPFIAIEAIKDENTKRYFKDAAKFLFNIFKSAVEKTNQTFNREAIKIPYPSKIKIGEIFSEDYKTVQPTYDYDLGFELVNPGNQAYLVLSEFWKNVSDNLSKVDKLDFEDEYPPHAFYHEK